MRVLLVAEQLRRQVPGGVGTYVRGLVRGLADLGPSGPEVTLWASRPPGHAPDPLRALGPLVTSPLPAEVLVWAWDRGWVAPPEGFAAVHAPSLAVPPVPPGGTVPLTVTVHDLAWRRHPGTFPRRGRQWHEAALGRALGRAAVLVAPSAQTADDLLEAGAEAGRVEVVAEGSDHLPPPDHDAAAALLRRLGASPGGYVLTVSTLEPRKNLARLADAFQVARPRFPEPWPLVVVGPKGWGAGLEARPGVLMAGWVDEGTLAGLYAGARVMVSVPLAEGFGLPALEAMAAGVPVVASPMPSTGDAALTVDPTDTGAIAQALVLAATDEGVRAELAEAGRARAAKLTWATAAAAHVAIWEAAADRARATWPAAS